MIIFGEGALLESPPFKWWRKICKSESKHWCLRSTEIPHVAKGQGNTLTSHKALCPGLLPQHHGRNSVWQQQLTQYSHEIKQSVKATMILASTEVSPWGFHPPPSCSWEASSPSGPDESWHTASSKLRVNESLRVFLGVRWVCVQPACVHSQSSVSTTEWGAQLFLCSGEGGWPHSQADTLPFPHLGPSGHHTHTHAHTSASTHQHTHTKSEKKGKSLLDLIFHKAQYTVLSQGCRFKLTVS